MPESLTPITREETFLAAIAGEEVSVPDPICRKEEFLDAIDEHIGSVEGDVSNVSGAVTALQTQIPASTAGDEGKVLTAGSTAGTASWQTPSGGGGAFLVVKASGTCTYSAATQYDPAEWYVGIDKTPLEVLSALQSGTPVLVCFPTFNTASPYYDATVTSAQMFAPFADTYELKDPDEQYGYRLNVDVWGGTVSMYFWSLSQV